MCVLVLMLFHSVRARYLLPAVVEQNYFIPSKSYPRPRFVQTAYCMHMTLKQIIVKLSEYTI